MKETENKKPAYPTLCTGMGYAEYSLYLILLKGMILQHQLNPYWGNCFYQQCQARYKEQHPTEWEFIEFVLCVLTTGDTDLGSYQGLRLGTYTGTSDEVWQKFQDERAFREFVIVMLTLAKDGHMEAAHMVLSLIQERYMQFPRKREIACDILDAMKEAAPSKREWKQKQPDQDVMFLDDPR